MIALIMAGGSGTRFWPASRTSHPKQFLRVSGQRSMLQLTFDRLNHLIPAEKIYVVTAGEQASLVMEHLPQIPWENIIIEPFGMNTAPCIALSVAHLEADHPAGETMIVLPADHVIKDTPAFLNSLSQAEDVAGQGYLVTFGIVPTHPATGYGYIETGEELSPGVLRVERFKEKPDLATATSFLRQGNFLWNSGMFAWTLDTIKNAFTKHLPAALEIAREVFQMSSEYGGIDKAGEAYRRMPRVPVDIGIMEPATQRAVIPVAYGWSDVGSWKALADISPADEDLNHFPAGGFAVSATDNYVHSKKFVALVGVDDLCVVETEDAILVIAKNRSEDVKKVVEHLREKGRDELL